MPDVPPCIIFEDAPDIVHIRNDETFTWCGVWLTAPKVLQELDAPPAGIKECGTCRLRWKKANDA